MEFSMSDFNLKLNIPPLLPFIQAATPVKTGQMRESWSELRPDDNTILMTNTQPYARIQVYGGTIPPFTMPAGKVMRAVIKGRESFFTSRGEIKLRGHEKDFIGAIKQWAKTIKVTN